MSALEARLKTDSSNSSLPPSANPFGSIARHGTTKGPIGSLRRTPRVSLPAFFVFPDFRGIFGPAFLPSETEPDDVAIRNGDLLNGQDFVFTMGVGNGMYGLDVFRVDASRNASYTFSTGYDDWWKRDFRISPAEVAKLVACW